MWEDRELAVEEEELLMLGKMEDRSSGPRVEGPDEKPGTGAAADAEVEVRGATPLEPKSAVLLLLVVVLLWVVMEASAEMGTVVLARLGR